ncbi:twin-arginine translocation (Tat) [Bradyrhizobium sp.]|uniref:twin-arginine translocation (Tat) n=1 Tax=Bradyrhizobium sp. TaxID=376 RepID=UPI003C707868
MERRHFLKLTVGFVAGAAALAVSAQAAPLPPISAEKAPMPSRGEGAEPAVVSQEDVDRLKPQEVHWGHHWHRHHHWGHRRWHRRHWHRHRW